MSLIHANSAASAGATSEHDSPGAGAPAAPGAPEVIFVLPSLAAGGAERVLVTLLKHLDRRRARPVLALLDRRGDQLHTEVPGDVPVVDLGQPRVRAAMPALVRLVWRRRPAAVMSCISHLNTAVGLASRAMPPRVRLVARETNVVASFLGTRSWPALWRHTYRMGYRGFDRIICQSQAMQAEVRAQLGGAVDRTVVIQNPIDLRSVRGAAETGDPSGEERPDDGTAVLRLVACGRVAPEKGFDVLIDALAIVERRVELTVIGDGAQLPDLRRQVDRLGLHDRVRFVGFQRSPYAWFRHSDAIVVSSRYESYPNVALEALACGTPVIALPAPGGLPELIGSQAGCAMASGMTAADLARSIDEFVPLRIPAAALDPFDAPNVADRYLDAILPNPLTPP